ncbi:MAG: oxidoreductase-like domain-containing protein [Pseudomonadota bacterium]|nr:oxidoreductase-like domain-containing protein [Pseudomonadota bacterium]
MSTTDPQPPADDLAYPPKPDRPDCCAGGCAQCVLDDYAEEMGRWHEAVALIDQLREERAATAAKG